MSGAGCRLRYSLIGGLPQVLNFGNSKISSHGVVEEHGGGVRRPRLKRPDFLERTRLFPESNTHLELLLSYYAIYFLIRGHNPERSAADGSLPENWDMAGLSTSFSILSRAAIAFSGG